MRFLLFICTILLPGVLMAEVFKVPPTDKSVDFLGYIFGPNIGTIYLGGVANPALLHMFERFNAVIITLGTMIISYVGIISTINTAQEGKVMGRKWSSIWIPLRSVMGMLVIVPAPSSGYSVIQTMVMWCIMQGIGAADNIWNSVLQDLNQGLSAAQGITRPLEVDLPNRHIYDALELIGADMAEKMLRSAVCMQTIIKINNGTAIPPVGGFQTPRHNNIFESNIRAYGSRIKLHETVLEHKLISGQQAEYTGILRIGIPGHSSYNEICGNYTITGIVTKGDLADNKYVNDHELLEKAKGIYTRKILALQMMFNNLSKLADDIINEKVSPRDESNRIKVLPEQTLSPGGYVSQAINTYREILKDMVKPQRIDSIQHIINEGMANGWLAAGSFYFTLNQTFGVDYFNDIATPPQTSSIPSCDTPGICDVYLSNREQILPPVLREFLQYGPEISYMGTRLWDSKIYLDNDALTISDKLKLSSPYKPENTPIQNLQENMLHLLQTMLLEQHVDPLIAQGRFGASVMSISERAWLDTQAELHVALNRVEQGYAPVTAELQKHINLLNQKGALSVAIYSIVWVIGAILAIYIPLIPYMIFTVAIIGWLLLVIEAVVAAPILAISFMLPSGDELGKVVQGLLLLLNILLRPTLMLFGFILSARLYQAVVKLINFGMLSNFEHLNTQNSLFAWVAILVLYAGFIVALSNKCFSLIYALPDKILRWMGSSPEHSDASHELQTTKSALQTGADHVQKISAGIPERNFARLQTKAKRLIPPDAVRGG